MNILALNCDSTSIKYKLYDAGDDFRLISKGRAEKIGETHSLLKQQISGHKEITVACSFPEHCAATRELLGILIHDPSSPINRYHQIDAVGHKIMSGGEKLKSPVVIDDSVMEIIRESGKFAPIHSRPNIVSVEEARQLIPYAEHVAIFDTALHQTLPPKAYLYGLPIEYYEKYGVRKYGFGGIKHGYVAARAADQMQQSLENIKLITCHLGKSCSITAFQNGKSIDTSMGLTPLEGLMMGSRSGDMDPSVILHLLEARHLYASEIDDLLNRNCGLKGLCGKSDMRDVLALVEKNDPHAKTALDAFVYRVQKYIGAYIAALNGLDAIVFTGGIGENCPTVRSRIMENFGYIKAIVDHEKNEENEKVFSAVDSNICLMNIPENEEMIIAKQTYEMLTKLKVNV
ncbi:MAG: acetate/propionate family kinase [Planctomycetes bacterium]|nr:acetate/propionate family kinase [Planctomycetota bacterium]